MNTAANIAMVVASLISTIDSAPSSIEETIQMYQEAEVESQNEFDSLQEKINQARSERELHASGGDISVQEDSGDGFIPPQSITSENGSQGANTPSESISYVQYSDLLPAGVDPNDPLIKDIPEWKLKNFKKIEKCESNGNPTIVSANGKYKGLYQFHDQTWAGIGGNAVAPSANLATPTQQLYYANKLEEAYGWSQWECAYIVGII